MKRLIIVLLAIALTAALSAILATVALRGSEPSRSPFVGVWTTTDLLDGSRETLSIKFDTGGVYSIRLYDDMASSCFRSGAEGPPALVLGGGIVDADVLHWMSEGWCLDVPDHPEYGGIKYLGSGTDNIAYDASTDTLFYDSMTWYRDK
jgi:hypothetical protein